MIGSRATRRLGSLLALLSIALQLFLTFSHVHLEDILGRGPFDPATRISLLAPHAADASQDADAAESCPLCASIMLAGSLLIPDAPTLRPAGFVTLATALPATRPVPSPPRYLRAPTRAPPSA